MIIKLCRAGVTRHIECVDVLQQPTANNTLDLEVATPKGGSIRVLIGSKEVFTVGEEQQWQRAYLMENGRTVDTIKYVLNTPPCTQPASPDDEAQEARIAADFQAKRNRGRQR